MTFFPAIIIVIIVDITPKMHGCKVKRFVKRTEKKRIQEKLDNKCRKIKQKKKMLTYQMHRQFYFFEAVEYVCLIIL